MARKIGTGMSDDLGSGAPILVGVPFDGRVDTAVGSSQTVDFYLKGRAFLVLSVTETP